jgi:hypothetical protein
MASFFEENELQETIGFGLLHPQQELLPVRSIALESHKSFPIDLYSAKGDKLPENCRLFLQSTLEGSRKVLSICSSKHVTDYSSGVALEQYYPFDHPQEVTLQLQHKGFKANFYRSSQSERFYYLGEKGHLSIRKKYLVYNYTMIPLNISDCVAIPGNFVGINGTLMIEGVPYQESPLKVVFDEPRQAYYIYSICYLVDYVGLSFTFEGDRRKVYSHSFHESKRSCCIYLLPSIDAPFQVQLGWTSSRKELRGRLAREVFEIQE